LRSILNITFNSIFKIDLLRTITEAIKRQIALNKDYDVVYFLAASEGDMAANGAKFTVDLDDYKGDNNFRPATAIDVFKSIIPHISTLMGVIKRNFQMYPTYLVCGYKTAAMLRSLQEMMITMPGTKGTMGFGGTTAQFLTLKILEAQSADEGKIYLTTKAPANALEKSTIIDLVYMPLYIVKEITDGAVRNYVRARTMVEIARTDGLGCIEVRNIDNYLANEVA
jgi:hypothetical protein